jgi:GNAT superfamily N-acetyltransferase
MGEDPPADALAALEDLDLVAAAFQLYGGGQPGESGTDYSDHDHLVLSFSMRRREAISVTENPGNVLTRRFAEGDREALLALAPELTVGVAVWRPAEGVSAAARGWVEEAVAGAGRSDRALLVAEHEGQVRGFLGVSERTHFSGQREAYIGELVVDPAARRRGIARALLAEARRWAAGRGLSRLTLETGCANDDALAFYRAVGFRPEQVMLSAEVDHLRA